MNDFPEQLSQNDPHCGDLLYLDHVLFLLVTCCDFAPEITLCIRHMGKKFSEEAGRIFLTEILNIRRFAYLLMLHALKLMCIGP